MQKILEYMPVTNLKPDNEDAENEEKLLANYNTKKKYRQVKYYTDRKYFVTAKRLVSSTIFCIISQRYD